MSHLLAKQLLPVGLLAGALLLMPGCTSTIEDVGIARGGVLRFHDQLNAEKYEQIFNEATEDFQKSGKKEDTLAFLKNIHEMLGKVVDTTQTRFYVNWTTSGTIVQVEYTTKFERREAAEKFTWRIEGNKASLLGYWIDSDTAAGK